MKKTFLTMALCAATMLASATVVVDETFTDFPTGWDKTGSVTTGAERSAVEALVYTDAADNTFALSGQGKAVQTALDASDKYQQVKALESAVTTDYYVSFLFRADGQQKQSQTQVFGLGGPSLGARLWVGKGTADATKCRLGVTRSSGSGSDVQWGTTEFDTDETMLIVLKYTMTATDTIASLYVNPVIGGTEPATAVAKDSEKGAGKCKKSLTHMTFYTTGQSKSYFTVGGVRVSTTWAEAVAKGGEAQKEEPDYLNELLANFGDSTIWENTLATAPAEGSFPTDTVDGYILTSTAIVKSGKTDTIDNVRIKFYARAHMDKTKYNPSIVTPFVQGQTTLYIYGNAGSDSKDVKVETRKANEKWTACETLTFMKKHALYTVTIPDGVQVRVSNTTTSSVYIFYIGTSHPKDTIGTSITGVENINTAVKSTKRLMDGQMVIEKNGVLYNAMGVQL